MSPSTTQSSAEPRTPGTNLMSFDSPFLTMPVKSAKKSCTKRFAQFGSYLSPARRRSARLSTTPKPLYKI